MQKETYPCCRRCRKRLTPVVGDAEAILANAENLDLSEMEEEAKFYSGMETMHSTQMETIKNPVTSEGKNKMQ